jgi:hypothetical protein
MHISETTLSKSVSMRDLADVIGASAQIASTTNTQKNLPPR